MIVKTKEDYLKVEPLLEVGEYGVLGVIDSNGCPYTLPISYAYKDGYLYFHGSMRGRKKDALVSGRKVSFSHIVESKVKAAEYSASFISIHVEGTLEEVKERDQKVTLLKVLTEKYSKDHMDRFSKSIEKYLDHTCVYRVYAETIGFREKK